MFTSPFNVTVTAKGDADGYFVFVIWPISFPFLHGQGPVVYGVFVVVVFFCVIVPRNVVDMMSCLDCQVVKSCAAKHVSPGVS